MSVKIPAVYAETRVIEAAATIGSGIAVGSLSLLAFGIDSLIELMSATVLIWRLTVEIRHGRAFSERAERLAARLGGGLLFALAAYVVFSAVWSLWVRHGQDFSPIGFAVTLAAIPIMYVLSKRKLKVADQPGSRAMRADAVESVTCGYLSIVVVTGLVAQLLTGLWWIDAVTARNLVQRPRARATRHSTRRYAWLEWSALHRASYPHRP
jgi:divalent metal cation (Fe/Co/Zn/Cd) transporter